MKISDSRWWRWLPVIFLVAAACITPIEFAVPETDPLLVVDGSITTEPGPYQLKLFKSFVVNDRYENPVPEFGATVTLYDDLGNSEVFDEVAKGEYQTSGSIRGTTGRSYYITIRTLEGKEYESDPETIRDPGTLDSLYYEYVSEVQIVNGKEQPFRGFRIYVDGKGSPEANLLRWKWTGTYRILTFPEQHTRITDRGPVPDPLPCSGYRYRDGAITQFEFCSCCTCWLNTYPDRPILSDEQFVSGNEYRKVAVAFVPLDRRLFHEKFHISVEQLSMSQVSYDFWKSVRDQKDGATSLFQPPNAKARSNVRAITPGEEVLGLFTASGVKRRSLFLYPYMSPDLILPIDTIKGSCLKVDPTATTARPDFW